MALTTPITSTPVISSHPGMGAILYSGGTAFRVWAKFATQVYVVGEFNNWSQTAHPLASEGNGYWSVDLYQSLIRLRRNWYNNTRGLRGQHVNVFHVNNNDKVIAFHRWENGGAGDDVVVVVNFGSRAYDSYSIGFPHEGTWWVRFNSDWNGYDSSFGNFGGYTTTANQTNLNDPDSMPARGNIGIAPYSALILSQ